MNESLRELYQELILDHNRNPRNHHEMSDATSVANGFNPLCGDKLTLFCKVSGDVIQDLSFKGCGCAISQASASLMTEALIGQSINDAHQLFQHFHAMMTAEGGASQLPTKIAILEGVKVFPARVKCATLAWHTFEALFNENPTAISTE
jgi:nitrogen fixation NifU-like protein